VNYIDQTVSTLQVTDSHKPFVDLYPEVQTLRSSSSTGLNEEKNKITCDDLNTSLVDWNQILIDMIEYKERSGYSNLILNKEDLRTIIDDDEFALQCPERRIRSDKIVHEKRRLKK